MGALCISTFSESGEPAFCVRMRAAMPLAKLFVMTTPSFELARTLNFDTSESASPELVAFRSVAPSGTMRFCAGTTATIRRL